MTKNLIFHVDSNKTAFLSGNDLGVLPYCVLLGTAEGLCFMRRNQFKEANLMQGSQTRILFKDYETFTVDLICLLLHDEGGKLLIQQESDAIR